MGAGKGMGMGLHASSLKARLIASVPRDAVTPVHSRVHAREHLMMGAGAISPYGWLSFLLLSHHLMPLISASAQLAALHLFRRVSSLLAWHHFKGDPHR